jgi:hypothetical protein
MKKLSLLGVLYAILLVFGSSAQAGVISLSATIDGAQANAGAGSGSPGFGTGTMTLDEATNLFSWDIQWSNLTGDVTAGHFHGPAAPGANAGIELLFDFSSNPAIGAATLTDGQEADLLAGLWYINIHSITNPGGEVRGQINVVPIPAAIWLFGTGLLGLVRVSKSRKIL